ncbi:hypothetical protein B0T17DRAFT_45596 [Bombardia bombarda]|uniref:Uncharacterized protein n=1 Tax=Bombardia bombarda TaxID=252184 RepID=A0AA40CFG7_9PEZI|nr:hypothetical protein B0T17DRAFT_45596 [Bombardia bombarda]
MRPGIARISVAVAFAAPQAAALLVAPDSPCSTSCGNVLSSTSGSDMACDAASYRGTTAGTVFESCITCETTSTYVSRNQTDLQSLLYNLRFNMGWCLWGLPNNPNAGSNPCLTNFACDPLKDAVTWNNFTTTGGGYDYCSKWGDDTTISRCSQCLIRLDNTGSFLNNYLNVLDGACKQKPAAGSILTIQGDLFGASPVVVSTPTPTYAMVPTPDYGAVSLGARVGIAFGGLAFILAVAGFCIVCNGKRRRRAFLRQLEQRNGDQGWPHPKSRYGGGGPGGSNGADMFETPVSQRPLNSWDESPVSAHTDRSGLDQRIQPLPRYFSPYNSQYNSPVSATDGGPSSAAGGGGVNWPMIPPQHQQRLDQLIHEQQSPVSSHGSPPPAFTHWPSPTQERLMMQMHHHEKRQNEIAIGLALGGDEASLRSKGSQPSLGNGGGGAEGARARSAATATKCTRCTRSRARTMAAAPAATTRAVIVATTSLPSRRRLFCTILGMGDSMGGRGRARGLREDRLMGGGIWHREVSLSLRWGWL